MNARVALLITLTAAGLIGLLFVPPFAQDTTYHDFADQRKMGNVPHALNVLSNLPFVVFGLWGVTDLVRRRRPDLPAWQWWLFLILFVFVALTGFGSAYYHAQPDNDTLYWDRLPLTVVFMAFFCLILADRVSPAAGPWLLAPLILSGVGSVTYWHVTELRGAGDVRFYAFVQFFPILTIPLVLLFFPARRYRTQDLIAVLAWYLLAKLLELLDREVYSASGFVSGHTLKHLAASIGALWVWVLLRRRQEVGVPPSGGLRDEITPVP
jgi:hypothetical protein